MKILFVGVFENPWSTNIFMKRAFEERGHEVEEFGHRPISQKFINPSFWSILLDKFTKKFRVTPFPDFIKYCYYRVNGRNKMNQLFLAKVKEKKYDLVLIAKGDTLQPSTIKKANTFVPVWLYFMDPLENAIKTNIYEKAKYVSYASSTFSDIAKQFGELNPNSFFLTEGFDTKLFKPDESKKTIDVVFAGSKSWHRKAIISYLKKNNVNVEWYGVGTKRGPVYLENLVDLYNKSKIILNINRSGIGSSDRIFQILGCRSFALSEYCKDIEDQFNKKVHLDWFKSKEECLEKINYYLKNEKERELLSQNGYEMVLKNYKWTDIVDKLILKLDEKKNN